MKIKVEYEVESKTSLPKDTEIIHNDRVYFFQLNDKGFIYKISITAKVEDPTKFYSVITPTPQEFSKAHFQVKRDEELYDSIIREFQDLESLLSFSYNVKGIIWNTKHYELIFDSEEEKEQANIFSWGTRDEPYDEVAAIDETHLVSAIERREKMSKLTLFMSFYREGMNDYKARKYINAFYNFYFILEGMYAPGQTRNSGIAKEFKKSAELRDFIDTILEKHIKPVPKHDAKITQMLKDRNMAMGIDAIIELLIRTRGELHHFNPKRIQGTPFNHQDFESITNVVLGLAMQAILFRMVDINTGKL